MGNKPSGPTLTDAKGLGGVIAQDGFDYQLWDGLSRLPAWLANPSFEEMIFEGLEDLEARFFAPQAPRHRLIERYQAKSGNLAPKDVEEVFESFQKFEQAYPSVARLHTLVTPRLPQTLGWLARDPWRVRKARPFYAPFVDVAAASDAKLKHDLIAAFGNSLGAFVADAVEVAERNLPVRDSALQAFMLSLMRSFPTIDVKRVEQAFEALGALARRNIGAPLSRAVLASILSTELGQALPLPKSFPLHIRSDRNEVDETALEIDASAFSGGSRPYPDPDVWTEGLVQPLDRTARWLRTRGLSRVSLGGSYRLTTGFTIGWSLRSAIGFELEIPTREGSWSTDERQDPSEAYGSWAIDGTLNLKGETLLVSIGILRDPSAELRNAGVGTLGTTVLRAFLPQALTSARSAQHGVGVVKAAVATAVAQLRPQKVDLYIAGPAAFAVALGHRWNGLPPTQLHEFLTRDGRYVPTALLK